MKTITLLELHAAAISTATSVVGIVRDSVSEDEDSKAYALKGDKYCGLSEVFGLVRELYREYPEKLRTEETTKLMDNFYIHIHEVDNTDLYDLCAARSAANTLHGIIYDSLFAARDAIALYS